MQGSTYLLLTTVHGVEFTVGVNYSAATLLWLCWYQRYQLKAQLKAIFFITLLCSLELLVCTVISISVHET